MTETDLSVLGPLAEHRVLITPQIALLLGVTHDAAARRMRRLREAGLVNWEQIYARGPGVASLTGQGRRALGLPATNPPELSSAEYRHDVGVAWLWLAARAGRFGRIDGLITEQAMMTADRSRGGVASPGDGQPPYGLGLGLFGPHGNPQRHYPDLLLTTHTGHRVALELELSAKSRTRLDRIMMGYATDARIDLVVYLVPSAAVARTVSAAAQRAGISDTVQVRRLAPDPIGGVDGVRRSRAAAPPDRGHSPVGTDRRRAPGTRSEATRLARSAPGAER